MLLRKADIAKESGPWTPRGRPTQQTTAATLSGPLQSPVWWGALAVLVLNDHYLKNAELLPKMLTGKLSDFAGLFVASVLLAALFGGSKAARALSVALIGVVFSAIKLSPEAAAFVERTTAMTGLPWRILVDPTDLVALLILPFAYRFCRFAPNGQPAKLTALLGGLACAASGVPGGWSTSSFIVNRTESRLDVRVRFTDAALDCNALRGRTGLAIDRSVFNTGSTFSLDPGGTLPLERPTNEMQNAAPQSDRCAVVLISMDDVDDTLVFWSQLSQVSVPLILEEKNPTFSTDGMLQITKNDGAFTLEPGLGHDVATIQEQIDPSTCQQTRPTRFQWTNFPERLRTTLTSTLR